jgi:hypothetical protein
MLLNTVCCLLYSIKKQLTNNEINFCFKTFQGRNIMGMQLHLKASKLHNKMRFEFYGTTVKPVLTTTSE